jgi:hypothetical protein
MNERPTCTRCGRPLRSEASIARRRGRHCEKLRRKEQAAKLILANYTCPQVEKVKQLLADGGVQRAGRHTWTAIASNGYVRYSVDTTMASCTCTAGMHGRICYHLAAAQLLAA